jgi:hypothetical protein
MVPGLEAGGMTLDPVHVDGIARLARRVGDDVDADDHGAVAQTAWSEFCDPLWDDPGDEVPVLEPLGDRRRRRAAVEDVALQDRPFPTHHGLDAGTINPTTFRNGLVVDVSQAAMAGVPSDVDLHRARTIVMTVHASDETQQFPGAEAGWRMDDGGYARRRLLRVPRVDRFEQTVVHALALYLAESEHALEQADVVEDLLVLDGPVYPTGLLKWADRDPALERLLTDAAGPRDVLANYRDLVETCVERDVPLVGFVKNSASKALTRALRGRIGTPWVDDAAFFRRLLERTDGDGDRRTDALTFTNWFRSRLGTDALVAPGSRGGRPAIDLDRDRALAPEDYEVTFFVVYDPRDDLVYRIEAPSAVTRDEVVRDRLTSHLLSEVAAERGPPRSVGKADALARIDRQGKETLRDRIEREFDTDRRRDYDEQRWGLLEGIP